MSADEVAVVVDNHTGRVKAQYQGVGAIEDAQHTQKATKHIKSFGDTSIITGEDALKAIKSGRT